MISFVSVQNLGLRDPVRLEVVNNQETSHPILKLLIYTEKMRRYTSIAIVGLVLLFGSAGSSVAQVQRVQMHIAGYLCGN